MKKIILLLITVIIVLSATLILVENHLAIDVIVEETNTYDFDNDGEYDTFKIYVKDNSLILKVNKNSVEVSDFVTYNEEEKYNDDISYDVVDDKILVAVTNNTVNKFGHATDLQCYTYDGALNDHWNNTLINNDELTMTRYENDGHGFIVVNNEEKEFVVEGDYLDEFNKYIEYMKRENNTLPSMEFRVINNHKCVDIDADGKKELLIEQHVFCGATSFNDYYVSVLEFDEEMTIVDGWLRSTNDKRNDYLRRE